MNPIDYTEFHIAWLDAHAKSSSNQIPSDRVVMSVFEDLGDYELDAVKAALRHHSKHSRFAPTPHDIVSLLDSGNRRLSADEAWAMMPRDESETLVWTEEMAAAYDIAYGLIMEGDRIAARMAFKAAYERFCEEAGRVARPVRWKVSIGYDKAKIEPVLQKAVQMNLITHHQAAAYLPEPMDGGPIAGLLTGKISELPNNAKHLKERWAGLKQAIKESDRKLREEEQRRKQEVIDKQLEFEERRRQVLDLIKEKMEAAK
jgi:hypothetical protein